MNPNQKEHNKPIIIPENRAGIIEDFKDPDDWTYLEQNFLKKNKPIEITRNRDHKIQIKNTSHAGIIQLQEERIHFSTKVEANFFYMLSYLREEKNIIYDSETIIDIEEGDNFFEVIANLFCIELTKIIEQGLLKRYVTKEENETFLKGKLLTKRHLDYNKNITPKFYIRYHDLTCDNQENQIILRALNLVIPMIRLNQTLKFKLLQYEQILKKEIELNLSIGSRDCDLLSYNRLNKRYKKIIEFSRLILIQNFIRSTKKGKSKGFNFLVNMPNLFEDFITAMMKEVIQHDEEFNAFQVLSQTKFNTLDIEKKITTKPDLILQKKDTEEYPLILDIKYKKTEKNSDFYQIIAYSLAIPTSKKCCLLYPKSETPLKEKGPYHVRRQLFEDNEEYVEISLESIDIFLENTKELKEFTNNIKKQLKNILKRQITI